MPVSAPVPEVITSKQSRKAAGVGVPYADAYNQSQMAQYNNEYNYWLWQQQQEYNSPANQRKRLEAAGLNPNYQSIDSGNVGSLPTSSGSMSPSISAGLRNDVQNRLGIANQVINSLAQGIKSTSELSGIPSDISTYRKLLSFLAHGKVNQQSLDNALKEIDRSFQMYTKLGIDFGGYYGTGEYTPEGGQVLQRSNIPGSPLGRQSTLRNESMVLLNALREFDLSNIQPQEERLIKYRVRQVSAQAGISEKQLQWFDTLKGAELGLGILSLLKRF